MSSRYDSKRQETFYQPWRLRLVTFYYRSWNRRPMAYLLAKQNQATHEVLFWNRNDHTWDEAHTTEGPKYNWGRKADALAGAKALAAALGLPFTLVADEIDAEDLMGPILKCLICGEEFRRRDYYDAPLARGHMPEVCPDCQNAVRIHKAESKERIEAIIPERSVSLQGRWDAYAHQTDEHPYERYNGWLARILAGVLAPSETVRFKRHDDSKKEGYVVSTQYWRVEKAALLLEIVERMLEIAYSEGQLHGSALSDYRRKLSGKEVTG